MYEFAATMTAALTSACTATISGAWYLKQDPVLRKEFSTSVIVSVHPADLDKFVSSITFLSHSCRVAKITCY